MNEVFAVAVILVAISISGYEVSYKRGASPSTMSADETMCRDAAVSDDSYRSCMREHGWFVADEPVDPSRVIATGPTAVDKKAFFTVDKATVVDSGEADTASSSAEPDGDESAVAQTESNEPISVSSWWKLAAPPNGLDRDIKACVQELGQAHRPAAGATKVSPQMYQCLRASAWFGF